MAENFSLKVKKLDNTYEGLPIVPPNFGDAGYDLIYFGKSVTLKPGKLYRFDLGIATEFPLGWVGIIKDRSSMGVKGLHVLGGVVDSSYRGDWGILICNAGSVDHTIRPVSKIAQVIFVRHGVGKPKEVNTLASSGRESGGFGSTGQ